MRYLSNVSTLKLDSQKCIGCGLCTQVCPHPVFELEEDRARIVDSDQCMECGACALNCPVDAITVQAGVGCAHGILKGWLAETESCCGEDTCCT